MAFFRVHDLINGFPTAVSGTAWFYLPGTTTPMVIFGDDTGTAQTNPVTLDSNGAALVYLSQLARMIVQTNAGVTVADVVINGDSDTTITTTSAAFSGTTLKDTEDAALVAFGGQDYQYVPSGSWVGMTPKNWMNSVVRNVMAYGSVGATSINDGVTPADSAIAAAIADVQAQGGGVVFFPKGTYLCNSGIAFSTTAITLRGVGQQSLLQFTGAADNGIAATNVTGLRIEDLVLTHTSTSTGSGILLTGCNGWTISNVAQNNFFAKALGISSTGGSGAVMNCTMNATSNATDRGVLVGGAGGFATIIGGSVSGGDADIEAADTTSGVTVLGCAFGGGTGSVKCSATTAKIRVSDCAVGTLPFVLTSTPTYFFQDGNGIPANVIVVATGATSAAPDINKGWYQIIHASSGGAGTVTVPAPTPATGWADSYLTIQFKNDAGGAVTWAFTGNWPVFVGAAVPANTAAHTIIMVFKWDTAASKWREVSRADTLT